MNPSDRSSSSFSSGRTSVVASAAASAVPADGEASVSVDLSKLSVANSSEADPVFDAVSTVDKISVNRPSAFSDGAMFSSVDLAETLSLSPFVSPVSK